VIGHFFLSMLVGGYSLKVDRLSGLSHHSMTDLTVPAGVAWIPRRLPDDRKVQDVFQPPGHWSPHPDNLDWPNVKTPSVAGK
jgi:hypothetical protein